VNPARANSVGVCAATDNGLTPTGKVCGAECTKAEDCCELPVEVHASIGANSCAELAVELDGVNCAAPTGPTNPARCFAQATYCECGNDTWACESGQCQYTAACTKNVYNAPAGCALYTRSGKVLPSCDVDSGKCQPVAAQDTCTTDASCTDKEVTDSPAFARDVCVEGECTCYKPLGACYRKCGEDLDCPSDYICGEDKVCVPEDSCSSDAQCVVRYNDVHYKCNKGICEYECQNDRDCNLGRLTNGSLTRVCDDQKRCVPVGCNADDECSGTVNSVRLFCTEPAAVQPGDLVRSAITD